jgi:hypothetical protein
VPCNATTAVRVPSKAEYMREWRKQRPDYQLPMKAYQRALYRLAEIHPGEFGDLLAIERVALGLAPKPDKSENNKKPKRRLDPALIDGGEG